MAAMKASPGLVNFFIYNSTFGPKEGMVCDFILRQWFSLSVIPVNLIGVDRKSEFSIMNAAH